MSDTPATVPQVAARSRLAVGAIALYGLIAAVWVAMAVLRVQRGSGPSLWALLPIAAYAAGLAYGTARLRPLPAPEGGWRLVGDEHRASAFTLALRMIFVHATIGALGSTSLATAEAGLPQALGTALAAVGLIVVPVAICAAALLSLLLPRCARGSDAYIVAAFGGAGWMALVLFLIW